MTERTSARKILNEKIDSFRSVLNVREKFSRFRGRLKDIFHMDNLNLKGLPWDKCARGDLYKPENCTGDLIYPDR